MGGGYLVLQKNLYWMRMVRASMTAPWIAMATRFLPTMCQASGSSKRSSPGPGGGGEKKRKRRVKPALATIR